MVCNGVAHQSADPRRTLSCHPFLTISAAEMHVDIRLCTKNDASVTHKARFLWQMSLLILHLDLCFSMPPPPPPQCPIVLFVVGLMVGEESHHDMEEEM